MGRPRFRVGKAEAPPWSLFWSLTVLRGLCPERMKVRDSKSTIFNRSCVGPRKQTHYVKLLFGTCCMSGTVRFLH